MRVLLVEDEHALGTWLTKALQRAAFEVEWVDDGRLAQLALAEHSFDVVILDLGLPGASGHQVLQTLRTRDRQLGVLILTARDSLAERVTSLNEGADDFLAKPFDFAELEARLRALIRRAKGIGQPSYTCGPVEYLPATGQFTLQGEPLSLSPRESALMAELVKNGGKPITKQHILDRVFPDAEDVLLEAVEVLIYRLRKRLEGRGVRIVTMRGLGYALEQE